MLLAQDCYGWGYKSVEILLDKIVKGKNPAQHQDHRPADPRHQGERGRVRKKWDKWLGK